LTAYVRDFSSRPVLRARSTAQLECPTAALQAGEFCEVIRIAGPDSVIQLSRFVEGFAQRHRASRRLVMFIVAKR
jgi:hypothetical protein